MTTEETAREETAMRYNQYFEKWDEQNDRSMEFHELKQMAIEGKLEPTPMRHRD